MKKAFWNGTEPITFQVVEYLVLPATVKTWWVNRVAFEVRQGVLIKTQNGHEFLIDNKFGDGYGKIASGGDPQVGHKSVENFEIKNYDVTADKIIYRLDVKGLQKEHEEHLQWIKENYPEEYEKTQALLKLIRKR